MDIAGICRTLESRMDIGLGAGLDTDSYFRPIIKQNWILIARTASFRGIVVFLLVGLAGSYTSISVRAQVLTSSNSATILQDIQALTAPQMEGRGDGSNGLTLARTILEDRYRNLGLEPKGSNGFLQPLTVTTGTELKQGNYLSVEFKAKKTIFKIDQDYRPFSVSTSASVSGSLVFVGYGITAKERNYDDYDNIDVKNKIVIALRNEPASFKAVGNLSDPNIHGQLLTKAINARNHGAKAILLLNGKLQDGEEDLLTRFGGPAGPVDAGIPFVQVKNKLSESWFTDAGMTLDAAQQRIESTGKPASFEFPSELRITLDTALAKKQAVVNNVLAYLPGKTDEYIILGAHYDHIGRGEYGSLAPSLIGQIHPGADDNASGTAALLDLARILSPLKGQLPRGILFASFAAEELGLLGSQEWVREPTLPIDKAVAMINMDMVGRVRKDTIYIGGVGSGSDFKALVEEANAKTKLTISYSRSLFSSSDDMSFLVKRIPALFFFSGSHADYHTPSDTSDKIDSSQEARVVDLVGDVALRLDKTLHRQQFLRPIDEQPRMSGLGSSGGYGPYFGSIPDFGQQDIGVRFADIRPGSPADKAGLKAQDVLIEFRGQTIRNLYDFTDALRRSNVGDVVSVTVKRDGKPLTVQVKLEQRK